MSREELRQRGREIRERLGVSSSKVARQVGFERFMTDYVYGAIWGRGVLSVADRALCALATCCALGRTDELRVLIPAALDAGLAPRAVVEVFIHAGLYAGFGITEVALTLVDEEFEERGISLPEEPAGDESLETLETRGEAFIAEIHGDRGKQGYASPDNPVTSPLYQLATQSAYGDLWLRPGLTRRERLLCALACFSAIGLETQLHKFSLSAMRVGISRDEIVEALMQTAPYCGYARALNALAVFSNADEGVR